MPECPRPAPLPEKNKIKNSQRGTDRLSQRFYPLNSNPGVVASIRLYTQSVRRGPISRPALFLPACVLAIRLTDYDGILTTCMQDTSHRPITPLKLPVRRFRVYTLCMYIYISSPSSIYWEAGDGGGGGEYYSQSSRPHPARMTTFITERLSSTNVV